MCLVGDVATPAARGAVWVRDRRRCSLVGDERARIGLPDAVAVADINRPARKSGATHVAA